MTQASAITAGDIETKQGYNQEVKCKSRAVKEAEILFSTLKSIEKKDLPAATEAGEEPISETTLREEKQALALTLFLEYRDGENVEVVDEQKAEFYLAHYFCMEPPESLFDNALFWLSWFTTFRLGIMVRGSRQLCLSPDFPIHNKANNNTNIASMFPASLSFLQLSYSLEIIVCLWKLFYYSFRPETQEDAQTYQGEPWLRKWYLKLKATKARFKWNRFNEIKNDDQFRDCMSNALVWLVANGVGLCFLQAGLPLLYFAIQIAGFISDIGHDYFFARKEHAKNEESLKILKDKNWEEPNLKKLKYLSLKKMEEKVNASSAKITRVLVIAVLICIGMAIIYFCPLLVSANPVAYPCLTSWLFSSEISQNLIKKAIIETFQFIGSLFVMLGGFFYGGLCGRLWRLPDWKKLGLRLLGSLKSNVPQLAVAGILAYYIVAPAILSSPIVIASWSAGIGAIALVSVNTVIVTSILLFAAIKCLIMAGKKITEWLPSRSASLSVKDCLKLTEILKDLTSNVSGEDIIRILGNLKKEEMKTLQTASGLNDSEWLRHVRNWSVENDLGRETSLVYNSFDQLLANLDRVARNGVVSQALSPAAMQQNSQASKEDNLPASSAHHLEENLSNPSSRRSSISSTLGKDGSRTSSAGSTTSVFETLSISNLSSLDINSVTFDQEEKSAILGRNSVSPVHYPVDRHHPKILSVKPLQIDPTLFHRGVINDFQRTRETPPRSQTAPCHDSTH